MLARGEISKKTVDEFDRASKGKKLPEKVKKAYEAGAKAAAEELRLKLPERTYHGFDAAVSREKERANKKTSSVADDIEKMLNSIDTPDNPIASLASRDPLDRATSWGPPSNLSGGDTASRVSDMGMPTNIGTAI